MAKLKSRTKDTFTIEITADELLKIRCSLMDRMFTLEEECKTEKAKAYEILLDSLYEIKRK